VLFVVLDKMARYQINAGQPGRNSKSVIQVVDIQIQSICAFRKK